ncbi:MAG: acyltransferase family protein [Stackebrandtia sp.]
MTVLEERQEKRHDSAQEDAASARESKPKETASFRPDIEGLRAVAVLLVVLGHAGVPYISGGYVGVDVFFVISGFLITTLLVKELRQTGTISIRGFYARRATRLLAASALVIVSTLIAAWTWLPGTRFGAIAGDAVSASLYFVNYRLANQETDYLNSDVPPSPLQHYWSLAVEEQFYVVWPLMLIALAWACRRRGSAPGVLPMATMLSVVLAVSLYLSVTQTQAGPAAYFVAHTRAWELAFGALLAITLPLFAARLPARLADVLTWLGLGMIGVAALTFDKTTAFPGYAALLPVAGATLAIAAGAAATRRGANGMLNLSPFQHVGRMSYSLYLWHWPVLMIAPTALDMKPSIGLNLTLAAVAAGLSALTYRLVENPIRFRPALRVRAWRGLAFGAGVTAATAAMAIFATGMTPALSGDKTAEDTEKIMGEEVDPAALESLLTEAESTQEVPSNLTPSLKEAIDDVPVLYEDDCVLGLEDVEINDQCVYGDKEADKTVVLFGDSHAAQWFPALHEIARDEGVKLLPMIKASCVAADVEIDNTRLNRRYTECSEWRDEAFKAFKDIKPELVIMASMNGTNPAEHDGDRDKADKTIADGWADSFGKAGSKDTEVAFIADTPRFEESVPDCVALNIDEPDECAEATDEALNKPDRTDMVVDAAESENVTVVDPVDWFCTDERCPIIVGNTLVYRDSNHITTTYAEALTPLLEEQLLST